MGCTVALYFISKLQIILVFPTNYIVLLFKSKCSYVSGILSLCGVLGVEPGKPMHTDNVLHCKHYQRYREKWTEFTSPLNVLRVAPLLLFVTLPLASLFSNTVRTSVYIFCQTSGSGGWIDVSAWSLFQVPTRLWPRLRCVLCKRVWGGGGGLAAGDEDAAAVRRWQTRSSDPLRAPSGQWGGCHSGEQGLRGGANCFMIDHIPVEDPSQQPLVYFPFYLWKLSGHMCMYVCVWGCVFMRTWSQ